jgi:hypothetical protein
MIENERQYRVTKAQVEKFERALAQMAEPAGEEASVNPVLREAMVLREAIRNGLRSQLDDLRQQLEDYEALQRNV